MCSVISRLRKFLDCVEHILLASLHLWDILCISTFIYCRPNMYPLFSLCSLCTKITQCHICICTNTPPQSPWSLPLWWRQRPGRQHMATISMPAIELAWRALSSLWQSTANVLPDQSRYTAFAYIHVPYRSGLDGIIYTCEITFYGV